MIRLKVLNSKKKKFKTEDRSQCPVDIVQQSQEGNVLDDCSEPPYWLP